ncbi:MAG: M28 family peptidase [Sphingomonadales bacterium]
MLARLLSVITIIFGVAACDQNQTTDHKQGVKAATHIFDASTRETASGLRDAAMKGSRAWEVLESLTTGIGPRLAGSENDARAVEWAVRKFHELGYDRVWTEPVKLNGWRRIDAEAAILAPYPHKMAITSLGLSTSTPETGIEAEVAHFKTIEDLMAAPADAAEGKIAFISNRMERHRDGSGYGPAVRARSLGASEAAKRGALAIIIRSIGTDSHRVPHTGAMRYEDGVTKIAAGAISNPDADILVHVLERGGPVRIRLKLLNEDLGPIVTANVIGEITGREAPNEIVLIGGHLDSWDLGTGAVDDGAGVAITMTAGHMIGALPRRPRRTIRVVAFGAEEVGVYGGKAYAAAHEAELIEHVMAAESDFGAGRIYALAPKVADAARPAMAEIAEILSPLGITLDPKEGSGGPDVGPMARQGVAVASLRQDGANYFDLHHTADDTLDKVDPAALDQNVAAYAAFAFLVAEYPGRFDDKKTDLRPSLETSH